LGLRKPDGDVVYAIPAAQNCKDYSHFLWQFMEIYEKYLSISDIVDIIYA